MARQAKQERPVRLYYAYADADERWQIELEKRLLILQRQGVLESWQRRKIKAGESLSRNDEQLAQADIILLLISPDFIASDYCWDIELQRALERHKKDEARIVPILLYQPPPGWDELPIASLQSLPRNGRPISAWKQHDDAFAHVAREIEQLLQELRPSGPAEKRNAGKKTVRAAQPWNVPFTRNPFFTGRENELRALRGMLTARQKAALTQPLAISGLGGIGKTQTAVEYAHRYRKQYSAVLWVNAGSGLLSSEFAALATLFNLPEQSEQEQHKIVAAVLRWLKEHTGWLLILDNLEERDLDEARDLLAGIETGHILLTTRLQALGSLANSVPLEKLDRDEGALLLLRRAKRLAPDAPLSAASEADRTAAYELVTQMAGLPLSLDQAGAYIEETRCSVADYLRLFQQYRKDLLDRRGNDPGGHPASVTATILLSLDMVCQRQPAARDLLRSCSFLHPDGIPEELFQIEGIDLGPTLTPLATNPLQWNELLSALLRASLIERDAENRLLIVHRLTQAVVQDEMDKETQQEWVVRAVGMVYQAFPDPDDITMWSLCERYLPQASMCAEHIERWQIEREQAAWLLNQAGYYLYKRGQYTEAEPLYQQALSIRQRVLGNDHPDTATSLNNLAELYRAQGKHNLAEPLYQQALSICQRVLGDDHPDTASSLNNLAELYRDQGKLDLAEPLFQQALSIYQRVLGNDHPNTAISLNNLAGLYYDQGKLDLAEPLHQQALSICQRVLGNDHPDTASSLNNLAELYRAQGKHNLAKPLYQQALSICQRLLGKDHPHTQSVLKNYLTLLLDMNRKAEAEDFLKRFSQDEP